MAETCGPCRLLEALILVYEAAVAETPGQELLALERFHGRREARTREQLSEGLVEELERFVTTKRPASEGSYHDAVAAWRLYLSRCVSLPGEGTPLCKRLRRLLAQRLRRALVIWGGSWSIDTGAAEAIASDLLRLHTGQVELEEYLRRHRSHTASAFMALHLTAPDEYPVFNTMLCSLVCRLSGGKRCSCSRMSHREWLTLYQRYTEAVREILSSCGDTLAALSRETGKAPTKLVDEALHVLYTIEEKGELEPSYSEAWNEVMESLGCPSDPTEARKRMEEWLRKLLRG